MWRVGTRAVALGPVVGSALVLVGMGTAVAFGTGIASVGPVSGGNWPIWTAVSVALVVAGGWLLVRRDESDRPSNPIAAPIRH